MAERRWPPATEADLLAAVEDGILDESTVGVEFKRQLPDNTKVAKELASLALNGGALLVGVVDAMQRIDSTPMAALHPIHLDGVPEKIENIAATALDPPAAVHPRTIPSADDPTVGYVWVDVPGSEIGPHMVDGRYWGRSGTSKMPLTDAQVRLHVDAAGKREKPAQADLADFATRHPSGIYTHDEQDRPNAGLHLSLIPLAGPSELALETLDNALQPSWIIRDTLANAPTEFVDLSGLGNFSNSCRIADGYAISDSSLVAGKPEYPYPGFTLFEIAENGTVRFHHHRVGAELDGQFKTLPNTIVGVTGVVLSVAGQLARTYGYAGAWSVAVEVGDISDSTIWTGRSLPPINPTVFTQNQYREATVAPSADLRERPEVVVSRLIGRLIRALGGAASHSIQAALGMDGS